MSVNPEVIEQAKMPKDPQSSADSGTVQPSTPLVLTPERGEEAVVTTPDSFLGNDRWTRRWTDTGSGERVNLDDLPGVTWGERIVVSPGNREIPAGSYRIVWRGDRGYFAQAEISYPDISGESQISESQLDNFNLVIYTPDGQVLTSVQLDPETGESADLGFRLSAASKLRTLTLNTPEGITFRFNTPLDAEAGTSRLISLEQNLPENDPSGVSLRLDEGGNLALINRQPDPLTGMQLDAFFDADFYLASNPDVANEVANGRMSDPLTHFQRHGQYEGRNPNGFFDTAFYLASNPDVAVGVAEGSVESAVTHFINHGQFDWRSPNPAYSDFAYLVRNPEALDALASGEFTTPVAHFLQVGQDQGFSAIPLA